MKCSLQPALKIYHNIIDRVDEYVRREQLHVVLKGQCEVDGVYPRTVKLSGGKLLFTRAWGAMRRGGLLAWCHMMSVQTLFI